MPLTVRNQLILLHDLLDEHIHYRNGNIAEYQRIKKIVRSLTANNDVNNEKLVHLLPEIYYYGIQGELAQNLREHIYNNERNIKYWRETIAQTYLQQNG